MAAWGSKVMSAKFAGWCRACKASFPEGTAIIWSKGAGARHAFAEGCAAALAAKEAARAAAEAARPKVSVGAFAGVVALFEAAKLKLKFPKITLMLGATPIKLSLAGAKSKTPGVIHVMGEGSYPYRAYYGKVSPEGAWTPSKSVKPEMLAALTALLTEFGTAPAEVAKAHGKLTGHCCFCSKLLGAGEDKRSIAVGFGPVCAENYGLTAEWRSGAAAAEAAAPVMEAA